MMKKPSTIAGIAFALALSGCSAFGEHGSEALADGDGNDLFLALIEQAKDGGPQFKLGFSAADGADSLAYCLGVADAAKCVADASQYKRATSVTSPNVKARSLFVSPELESLEHRLPVAVVAAFGNTIKRGVFQFVDKDAPVEDPGAGGGGAIPRACNDAPSPTCEGANCSKLVNMKDDYRLGYFNDNRDTSFAIDDLASLQRVSPSPVYSYMRKDFKALVDYAAHQTTCRDEGPAKHYVGLGDLADANAKTPAGRHPNGSHDFGLNADIAYFQTNTLINRQVAVCQASAARNCVSEPTILDVERTARFVAHLHEYPYLDVVAMDARIGPVVLRKLFAMCGTGEVKGPACTKGVRLWWDKSEAEDLGWFHFHENHMHVRLSPQKADDPKYFEPFYTRESSFGLRGTDYEGRLVPVNVPHGPGCGHPH